MNLSIPGIDAIGSHGVEKSVDDIPQDVEYWPRLGFEGGPGHGLDDVELVLGDPGCMWMTVDV